MVSVFWFSSGSKSCRELSDSNMSSQEVKDAPTAQPSRQQAKNVFILLVIITFLCFNVLTRLQVNLQTKHEGAARSEKSAVDALIEHAVGHGELGVVARVVGQREEVLSLGPYRQALQPVPRVGHGHLVGEVDGLQAQIAAVLNPAVAEAIVAHGVAVGHARQLSGLTLIAPTVDRGHLLVVECGTTVENGTLIVVHIVAQRVVEAQ